LDINPIMVQETVYVVEDSAIDHRSSHNENLRAPRVVERRGWFLHKRAFRANAYPTYPKGEILPESYNQHYYQRSFSPFEGTDSVAVRAQPSRQARTASPELLLGGEYQESYMFKNEKQQKSPFFRQQCDVIRYDQSESSGGSTTGSRANPNRKRGSDRWLLALPSDLTLQRGSMTKA
jgi:hypothetical protein